MKNDKLINKKALLHTTGLIFTAYALTAIAIIGYEIANYDTQDYYTKESLERAHDKFSNAMAQYDAIYTDLEETSYNAICKDAKYLKLHTNAEVLKQQIRKCDPNSLQYAELCGQLHQIYDEIALREDSLTRAYINNHPNMRNAKRQLQYAEAHLERVQRSCKALDSVKQISKIQRLKSNWNKFCADWQMVQNIKQKQK